MYVTIFSLSGIAILAWVMLIFLPTWRVTRKFAELEIFPVYLTVLYAVGLISLLTQTGLSVIQDFGSAEGVISLLAKPDIALIAWIHILAFDQLVGLLIYRDNMEHRNIPLVGQSILLFFTLMFGPLGYLGYYLIRTNKKLHGQLN
ncbi:DUF4281 domain-containing protein [bacterium]|nr:DUF4281 domain-containing protein [bacterium]